MTLGVLVCELQVSTRQVHELSSHGPEPPTSHVQNGLVDGKGGIQGESGSHQAEGPDRPRVCWGAKQLFTICSRSSHSATLPQACEFPMWQMERGAQDGRELDRKEKMLRSNRDKTQGPGPALASAGRRDYGYWQAEQHQTWRSWAGMLFPPDQTMEEL